MLSAVLALVGALIYGSADFLGGLAAKRLRSIIVTSVAAASGFVLLACLYPFIGGAWSATDVAWGALSGLFGVGAIVLLYACLAIGPMSILSPLTAVVSAIAPMLWGLTVNGETLSGLGYAGLAVALVAVVLVGFIPGEKVVRPRTSGLVMAVGAGICIGGFLIVIDQTSAQSGLVPLVVNRATSTVITAAVIAVLAGVAVRRGQAAASVLEVSGNGVGAMPSGHADLEHAQHLPTTITSTLTRSRAWWLAITCGAVDAIANVALLLALRAGELSIVSALTALYPAGTILLAAIVLRERIAAVQWVGLALAVAAGVMLAVG
ncbi:hypothetical protein ASD65_06760 [Microbacterium sp. Root61]|uniref:EamA family transporter n=1 Tax=Microbacterium sp. Root61 TaxID=1736570 RepID=UPI0006FAF52B|nr:EamA family transporter [Microbacterium sp. Root61]KRA24157.1 hypothetical protein ASD65_06760 [Microbacterium sp. Root61]